MSELKKINNERVQEFIANQAHVSRPLIFLEVPRSFLLTRRSPTYDAVLKRINEDKRHSFVTDMKNPFLGNRATRLEKNGTRILKKVRKIIQNYPKHSVVYVRPGVPTGLLKQHKRKRT